MSMLHLCDHLALLIAVKRWIGEGGKVPLVGVPDADILWEAVKELRKKNSSDVSGQDESALRRTFK